MKIPVKKKKKKAPISADSLYMLFVYPAIFDSSLPVSIHRRAPPQGKKEQILKQLMKVSIRQQQFFGHLADHQGRAE